MLCASLLGKKLKPLVIGHSNRLRAFKNVKKPNLPVDWRANKQAWMTASLFSEWVSQFNKKMMPQSRKFFLLLDNCPVHCNPELSNITLSFLPPDTKSILQPLDQGIIRSFKAFYRKYFLREIVSPSLNAESHTKIVKSVIRCCLLDK